MAFSSRFPAKAKPAPGPAAAKDEDSDEVESVKGDDDSAKAEEAERISKIRAAEEEARQKALGEAKLQAEKRERERKAVEDASRARREEAARKWEAEQQAKKQKEEYEYEKKRQETIARSKKETAKRAGFGGGAGGGGGFGGGAGGGSFAWKKGGAAAPAPGASGAPGKALDPRSHGLPSHDECEMGISAMISRTGNGMKEGLTMLGLPNFPLIFIPGQELQLCGHNLREEVNEMIHNWMTDEKEDFYACLQKVKDVCSRPILTEEEMEMMEDKDQWVKTTGPGGRVLYTKRDPNSKSQEQAQDEDSGDEVIDIVPAGAGTAAAPPAASGGPARAPAAAPVAAPKPAAPAAGVEEDFYALLGVSPTATLHEIRSKFRTLVVTEHPEKGGDPKKFQKLNKAYGILSDQKKRQEYDDMRGGGGAARPKNLVD